MPIFLVHCQCLESVYDSDYSGKHDDAAMVCYHRERAIIMVAFEGTDTGRKYLGCGVVSSLLLFDAIW